MQNPPKISFSVSVHPYIQLVKYNIPCIFSYCNISRLQVYSRNQSARCRVIILILFHLKIQHLAMSKRLYPDIGIIHVANHIFIFGVDTHCTKILRLKFMVFKYINILKINILI